MSICASACLDSLRVVCRLSAPESGEERMGTGVLVLAGGITGRDVLCREVLLWLVC